MPVDTLPAPAAIAPATPKPSTPAPKPSAPAPAPVKAAVAPSTPEPELSSEGKEMDDKLASAFKFKGQAAKKDAEPAPPKEGVAAVAPAKDKKIPTMEDAPKHFRDQYETVKAEATAAKQKITEYEAKIKDAEKHGESVKVLTAQLEAKEKALGEMQGQLRMFKQEMSPEFIAKWDKPYHDASEIARRSIQRLRVTDPKTGEVRQASWEKDFARFFKDALGDEGIIDFEGIKELFGDGAGIVTNHMEGLLTKYDLREKALGEEKAQWQTKQKEDEAKEITNRTQQEAAAKKFQADEAKFSAEFVAKNPELYDDIPDDDEGNKLRLEAQQELAKQPKTPDEAIAFRTKLYHKAANFDREHYLRLKAEAERDSDRATIEEMKGSGPGKTRRSSAEAGEPTGEGWKDEARRTAGNG